MNKKTTDTRKITEEAIKIIREKGFEGKRICKSNLERIIPYIQQGTVNAIVKEGRIKASPIGTFKTYYRKIPQWIAIQCGYTYVKSLKIVPGKQIKRKLNK